MGLNGASRNVGVARAKDGTLEVVWSGPAKGQRTAVYDMPISPSRTVGNQQTIVSGWSHLGIPDAATAPDGSVHAFWSGAKTSDPKDPTLGTNEATGPATWQLDAAAISIENSPDETVSVGMLKDGNPIETWTTGPTLYLYVAELRRTPPGTSPQRASRRAARRSPSISRAERR
jgi:hypothetical protein